MLHVHIGLARFPSGSTSTFIESLWRYLELLRSPTQILTAPLYLAYRQRRITMDASDKSRFIFTPGSALASRKIIEESSYTTTPDQFSADPTPPCGEAIYRKKPIDAEKLKTVNMILKKIRHRRLRHLSPSEMWELLWAVMRKRTSRQLAETMLNIGKFTSKHCSHIYIYIF